MKIYFSPASPFVRKCLVVAAELGMAGKIEKLSSAAHPVKHDQSIMKINPLGQVPTFLTDDGQAYFDSRVICEYLNEQAQGSIFPVNGPQRWRVLTEQSLADGILDAALLARYEIAARPQEFQWSGWTQGQMDKIEAGLAWFEEIIAERAGQTDIGTISLGCALGYLDFRFVDFDWRSAYPQLSEWFAGFSQRESMQATEPTA